MRISHILATVAFICAPAYSSTVVVYGGQPAGVAAAWAAKKTCGSSCNVYLYEPGLQLGGDLIADPLMDDDIYATRMDFGDGVTTRLTGSGFLGQYTQAIHSYYSIWPFAAGAVVTAEPSVVDSTLRSMLASVGVQVFTGYQANNTSYTFPGGVMRLSNIGFTNGKSTPQGDPNTIFIDASQGAIAYLACSTGYVNCMTGKTTSWTGTAFPKTNVVQDYTWSVPVRFFAGGVPADGAIGGLAAPAPLAQADINTLAGLLNNGSTGWYNPYGYGWNSLTDYRSLPDFTQSTRYSMETPYYVGVTKMAYNANTDDVPATALDLTALVFAPTTSKQGCRGQALVLAALNVVQSMGLNWGVDEPLPGETADMAQGTQRCGWTGNYGSASAWLGGVPYMREAVARIRGPYQTFASDTIAPFQSQYIPTAVAIGAYNRDFHQEQTYQTSGITVDLNTIEPADQSQYGYQEATPYSLPYESLISTQLPNVMFSGYSSSFSRMVSSSARVHSTQMRIGDAAGVGAGLSVLANLTPQYVSPYEVQQFVAGLGDVLSPYQWSDVLPGNPYWTGIQYVAAHHWMTDAGNGGAFRPNDAITRQEAAEALALRAPSCTGGLGITTNPSITASCLPRMLATPTLPQGQQIIQDLSSSSPYYPGAEYLLQEGITAGCGTPGVSPPSFCPTDSMSRGATAVWLVAAAGLIGASVPPVTITDIPSNHPLYPYISVAVYYGWMPLFGGYFYPGNTVPRGEFANELAASVALHPSMKPSTSLTLQMTSNR